MSERNVTVKLRMIARQYIGESKDAATATRGLSAEQEKLAAKARAAGTELDRTSRSVESSSRRTGRAMLYTAAGVAAAGAAGGGLKLLPPLLAATAAAGAALPPMLLGAAAAGGVLATSVKGVGKAMGEVVKTDDPFGGLSRSGRALVGEVKRLQPAMSAVRKELQDRTLAGTAQDLSILATVAVPAVRGQLNALADDWSDLFREVALAVADPRFTEAFNTASAGADWFFDLFNARVGATVRSIGTLVKSADPLARAFGQGIINAIDRFNSKVDQAARSGRLQEFFADSAEGGRAFLDLMGGILQVTGQLIGAASRQGNSLRESADALQRYIDSGRSAQDMAGVMNTLAAASEGLRQTLAPLGAVLRDALADPGTAAAVAAMFDVLAAGSSAIRLIYDLFSILPDPIQATVLAAAALAVVGRKVATGLALVDAGAGRAAARLTTLGGAGVVAGRGLTVAAAGAGKLLTGLVALEVLDSLVAMLGPAGASSDRLGKSLEALARKGEASGEMARLWGENLSGMNDAAAAASDNFIPKLFRVIEKVPLVKPFNELLFGKSFSGSKQQFDMLNQQLASYIERTGDAAGASEIWRQMLSATGMDTEQLVKLMPDAYEQLSRVNNAANGMGESVSDSSERTKILAGSFHEAALAGKDLAATMDLINGKNVTAYEAQIQLEAAWDAANEAIRENGRVTKKGTHELNLSSEAGRESMDALLGLASAATSAADSEAKRTGKTEDGIKILNKARERIIKLATEMLGSKKAAIALADSIIGIPDKDVKVTADTRKAESKTASFIDKYEKYSLNFPIGVNTGPAARKLEGFFDKYGNRTMNFPIGPAAGRATGGIAVPRQRGGVTAAAGGLLRADVYPAGDPPLYQFAEKETGGELFLPRRGDRRRGREILAVGAAWYGAEVVPVRGMRAGGVAAAASGLVTVAPASDAGADRGSSRLDSAEAYLRARDAVGELNRALKDNGRSFSLARAKGRENRQELYAVISAARDAARAKFDETGSVSAANRAYDQHIARLRATLRQQKVSAATIRQLLALAQRPPFTVPPPAVRDSSANVAFARADIAARGGAAELADRLSLNLPWLSTATEVGRENLGGILSFLEQAGSAAQARFEQTGNAATATRLYEQYLAQMRAALRGAGFSAAQISGLVQQFGRITLTRNDRGGVYMASAGAVSLSRPEIYPSRDRPMYGWAEPGTGGELFLPRRGDQRRGEDLLAVAAGWYGGRFTPGGVGAGGDTHYHNVLNVTGAAEPMTMRALQGLLRQMDLQSRVGRRR